MRNITLKGLLEADTATLRAVADHWLTLVDAIDTTVGDLGAETGDLQFYWTGDDSVAAQERVAKLRTQIGNAHVKCAVIADAMRDFADDLDHYKKMLHNVVDEARGGGMTIDLAAGTVTAQLSAAGDQQQAQASVDAYVSQITEILEKASDVDMKTRKVLDANSVGENEDLSSTLDYREEIDAVTLSSFPTLTETSQASIWHYSHPMEKDRLLNNYPEMIGAARGLPSEDRDRANRVLLDRERTVLMRERTSPDSGAVSSRLAAIDRLESRLDDPGKPKVYLVDYKPGDEENTELTAADPMVDDAWSGSHSTYEKYYND
ncbi:hypothetical protein GCM10010435_39370 [Winogradskya consettensis]|uniref:Uncharacterized protein n=1 Tax=Winogradskya consettensis TaxID=113560 RepID=A0A919SCY4_9ACTN|nr:hypothetical protein [Actinoplanes consettensis]GIM69500.1 hypothetical protein Aco04nite_15500 [Actinoplanes consettensis]